MLPISNPLTLHCLHGSEMIEPVPTVRDLRVLLDDNLTMKQHVNKVAAACYTVKLSLRRLRQIRRWMHMLLLSVAVATISYGNFVQ